MDNNSIADAADSLSIIQKILSKTLKSFRCAGSFFLAMGIFMLISFLTDTFCIFYTGAAASDGHFIALMSYIHLAIQILTFTGTIILFCFLRSKIKKTGEGLSLKLVDTWGFILIASNAAAALSMRIINLKIGLVGRDMVLFSQAVQYIPIMLMVYATAAGLFITGLMTEKGSYKVISILYLISEILLLFLMNAVITLNSPSGIIMNVYISSLIQQLLTVAVFFYLGISFRAQKE